MNISTQSEALNELRHRRQIRKKLRNVLEETQNAKEILENLDNDTKFNCIREKMNGIEADIEHVREMQLDALILKELAQVVHQQGIKLEDYRIQLNLPNLISCLSYKYGDTIGNSSMDSGGFPWARLGRDVGIVFRSVPSMETMYGPIYREPKVRKQIERKTGNSDNRLVATKAAEVINDGGEDETEASKKRQSHLASVIDSLTQKLSQSQVSSQESAPKESIDVLKLLVDSDSVVQTVENVFDFSFMVKKKYASIFNDDSTGLPLAIQLEASRMSEGRSSEQRVLSLNIREVKKLMKIMSKIQSSDPIYSQSQRYPKSQSSRITNSQSVIESGLLHRESELYGATNVWDQANLILSKNAQKLDNAIGNISKKRSSKKNNDENEEEINHDNIQIIQKSKGIKRKADVELE